MSRIDEVLERSTKLAEKTTELEKYSIELQRYSLLPENRKALAEIESNEERGRILNGIIERVEYLIAQMRELLRQINIYYMFFEQKNIFVQKRHFRLTKRFAYNALIYCRKILGRLRVMLVDLEKMRKPLEQKKMENLFYFLEANWKTLLPLFNDVRLSLTDVHGRLQIERHLVTKYRDLKKYLIDRSDLLTGDILVSFKSKKVLKAEFASKSLAWLAASQVTHVLVAARLASGVRIIDSHPVLGKVSMRDFKVAPGEVFIVLRPKITRSQRVKVLMAMRAHLKRKTKYAMGRVLGTIPSHFGLNKFMNMFTRGYYIIPNISRLFGTNKNKIFCSEFVDEVFKEAGVMLTTKSRYSNMVYPSDIVASPMVEYVGLVFEDSERTEEIITRYMEKIKV